MFELIDWSLVPLLFGISFGQSSNQQSSETGFNQPQRGLIGANAVDVTGNLNPFLQGQISPGSRASLQLPGLNSNGLYAGQQNLYDTGFNQAVTKALSGFSGNEAARGFLQPSAVANIAGSAAQQVAPQFAQFALPLAGHNILQQTTVPEQLMQGRTNQLIDFLKSLMGVPGGTGQGSGSSFTFGLGNSLASIGNNSSTTNTVGGGGAAAGAG